MQDLKDITIIGAGPTGLFAAFYAGMRGASHRLIDNLDQLGGQLTALYPEKYVFDVAGFPKVLAKDLVKGMAEQGLQWKAPVHLGEKVVGLREESDGDAPRFVVVTDREEYPSRAVLIAGGIGAFTPRKLPLKDADHWLGRGLYDRVLDPQVFREKRTLIVGGGDSAFDWCLNLEGITRSTTLIHRRDRFRAFEDSVRKVMESRVRVKTFTELGTIEGADRVEAAIVVNNRTKTEERLAVSRVLACLGFSSNLGALKSWRREAARKRAVPAGTVGGLMATTRKP